MTSPPSTTPQTVPALLRQRAREHPAATALRAPGSPGLTYLGLREQVDDLAGRLAARVRPDDRVLVPMTNTPEAVVAVLAAMSAAIAVPVDAAAIGRSQHVLSTAAPALVLVPAGGDPVPDPGIPVLHAADVPTPAGQYGEPAADRPALLVETSGSTTRPRLVELTHGQWLDGAARVVHYLDLRPGDRTVNLMPLFHNHGLNGAVLASLCAGGEVVCPGEIRLPQLAGWLAECRPTWLTAAPVVHAAVLDATGADLAGLPLRVVRSTSAPLPDELARRWAVTTSAPLVEAYAVTEAAGQVAATEPGVHEPGTVGVARHGFEIEVRDEDGRPCAPGVRGEVVVRGPAMAQRYHADPQATARVFVDGWLRTGDIGWLDQAARLRVVGRTSDTVNRGGEKVWLPDIDAACLSHPLTHRATAFGVPHPRLGEDVEVAVVPVAGQQVVPDELRHYLSGRLAPHLVPRRVHVVDELPGGSVGKPQRRLLAERFATERVQAAGPSARPPLVAALAALWCDVLGVGHVDDEDDFLSAGGDSILGTKLLASVSEVLGVDLPTSVLYGEGGTPAGMARLVAAARDTGSGREDRGVRPRGDDRPAPLSFGQQRLWALHQFAPDSPAYNVPLVFRLSGPLDEDALESAVRGLVDRHEVLRGRIVVRDGVPAQVTGSGTDVWLRKVDAQDDHASALALVERDARRPFALDRGSPVRALLVRIAADEALFALTLHHLVTDGWSNDLVVRELTERYAAARTGRPVDLPPLPVQYADFAAWERERMAGPLLAAGLDWWRERLADLPPPLVLEPVERPAVPGTVGHAVPFALDAGVLDSLRELARSEGTTLAVVLLAGCHAALARHTGATDLVVGLLSADRPRPELHDLVGFFLTTLPTRLDCGDDPPFRTLVRRARDWVVAAYDRQDVPFDQVVKAVVPDRALGVTPLTQVTVGVEKEDTVPRFDGVSAVRLDNLEGGARADLEFHFHEGATTVTGQLVHAVDVVRFETASALITRLVVLLRLAGRDPRLRLSEINQPNNPLSTNGAQA
ncbi:condensation domain-containing protein [Actinosynnema sp. NPDC050801]|uniref:condensation domain-containing protein n=1 Tax=unclassified Actinosynnema TaxID=2637065 RepID=UPI0033CFA081